MNLKEYKRLVLGNGRKERINRFELFYQLVNPTDRRAALSLWFDYEHKTSKRATGKQLI